MSTFTVSNILYTILDGSNVQLTSGASATGSVTIPATVTDPGTSITYAVSTMASSPFYNNTNITSVTFDNGTAFSSLGTLIFQACNNLSSVTLGNRVTTISAGMFLNCRSLTSITIPSTVSAIGESAFNGSGLTSITIPNTVLTIGISAFSQILTLTSATFDNGTAFSSLGLNIFKDCTSLSSVTLGNRVTTITSSMFQGCTALTSFTIPSTVSRIDVASFNASGLTSITIPNTVLDIGNVAFSGIPTLTNVTFDNGTAFSSLGPNIFYGCTLLSSVTLGNRVTTITSSMFYGCTSLTSFTIPSTVTAISDNAFDNTRLTSITIPNTVLTIGSQSFTGITTLTTATFASGSTAFSSLGPNIFRDCTSLSSVTLGNRVTTIASSMFNGCTSLTSFTIPSTVLSISDGAFGNTRLTSITIPNTVLTIGNSVFYGVATLTSATFDSGSTAFSSLGNFIFADCSSLSSVTLGNRVTTIASYMFNGCTSLTSFTIPSTVTDIGDYAFDNTRLTSITIPNTVLTTGGGAFEDISTLTSATFASGSTAFSSLGNAIFSGCTSLASVTLGNRVTTITTYMFSGCTSLTSFTIPSTVSTIGSVIFYNAGLTSITIPNTVLTIGAQAFQNTPSLTTATFASGSTAFSSLGGYIFSNCSSLSSVTLGNRVTTIASYMFNSCTSLTSFTIPSTVSSIGSEAFAGCANLLTVTFSGLSLPVITAPNFTATGDTAIVFSNATPISNLTPYFTNIEYVIIPVICFKEDSKILCLVNNKEVYLPIQNLRKGVLVKTYQSGYIPVDIIGCSKIYNPGNKSRSKARLYKCTPSKYPELTEDLYITGCHSILVDDLTDEQKERNNELAGMIMVTENNYRLMACIDDRAEPYDREGLYTIWHLALDNYDEQMNYGIYANGGLLVETTSKRMLLNYSGMDIL